MEECIIYTTADVFIINNDETNECTEFILTHLNGPSEQSYIQFLAASIMQVDEIDPSQHYFLEISADPGAVYVLQTHECVQDLDMELDDYDDDTMNENYNMLNVLATKLLSREPAGKVPPRTKYANILSHEEREKMFPPDDAFYGRVAIHRILRSTLEAHETIHDLLFSQVIALMDETFLRAHMQQLGDAYSAEWRRRNPTF